MASTPDMTGPLERVHDAIRDTPTAILATATDHRITQRTISPVLYQGNVLIFTHPTSYKYQQLQANPYCSLAVGDFFLEAKATFCGATMLEQNAVLRQAYCVKFPDAFDPHSSFNGCDAEFILLKLCHLAGWFYDHGIPTQPVDMQL